MYKIKFVYNGTTKPSKQKYETIERARAILNLVQNEWSLGEFDPNNAKVVNRASDDELRIVTTSGNILSWRIVLTDRVK